MVCVETRRHQRGRCWRPLRVHDPEFLPGRSRRDQHLSAFRLSELTDLCCLLLDRTLLLTNTTRDSGQSRCSVRSSVRFLIWTSPTKSPEYMWAKQHIVYVDYSKSCEINEQSFCLPEVFCIVALRGAAQTRCRGGGCSVDSSSVHLQLVV